MMTNSFWTCLIDSTLVLRILLLFRPIVTNQLARSVSFKDRLLRRNVTVIDSWLVITSRWWRGVWHHLSLVANTQYCARSLGVTGRLVSGYSLPLSPLQPLPYRGQLWLWITWGSRVEGDGARLFFDPREIVLRSPCAVRPVNSCRICSDARNIGLFITATISGLPKCCHVIMII